MSSIGGNSMKENGLPPTAHYTRVRLSKRWEVLIQSTGMAAKIWIIAYGSEKPDIKLGRLMMPSSFTQAEFQEALTSRRIKKNTTRKTSTTTKSDKPSGPRR